MSYIVTVLLLLVAGAYVLLHSSWVQTVLVQYFTHRIEQTTGVKIKIGGVDLRPMKSLVLNDVLVRDFRDDTLFYCKDFQVKVDSFHLSDRSFTVREVTLDHAFFNLWMERGEKGGVMNVDLLLDSLQRGEKASSAPSPAGKEWMIGLNKVRIRNSRLVYKEKEYEPAHYEINWTDVDCRQLNMDISEPDFSGGKVRMRVSGLSLVEKSGFILKGLEAKVEAGDSVLKITEGRILTDSSDLHLELLRYDWKPGNRDWRHFTTRMQQYYRLGPSKVSFRDLAYFNERLRGIENTVGCSGEVFNTVNRIQGRNLKIELGDNSILNGEFKSYGLPDFWNTIFEIDFRDTRLNPSDLESVYLPWLAQHIQLPAPLHHWKYFQLEGNFRGTMEDFVLSLKSVTPGMEGKLKFAYAPAQKEESENSVLSGNFAFPSVSFARLAGTDLLGRGSISGACKGRLSSSGFDLNMKGRLNSLNVYKGKLEDADLFLTLENEKLNLIFSVDKPDVKVGMTVNYDMGDTVNFLGSRGQIDVKDLRRFGWSVTGEAESLSTLFDLVYAEDVTSGSFAHLNVTDFFYSTGRDSFNIERISLENQVNQGFYTTSILSDVADLEIEGHYMSVRPIEFTRQLVLDYLPAYVSKEKKMPIKMQEVDFRYQAEVKDANRVLNVLYPEYALACGTRVFSVFDGKTRDLQLSVWSDSIRYKNFSLIGSKFEMKGSTEKLEVLSTVEEANYGSWGKLYNLRNYLALKDNDIESKLQWCNWGNQTYSGELSANVKFVPLTGKNYKTEVAIRPGIIVMSDSVWQVGEAYLSAEDKDIVIRDFSIRGGQQSLSVNGKISGNPEDTLSVRLQHFNLEELNRIVFNNRLKIFGKADGNVTIQDYYGDNLLYSDIRVENWGVSGDTLGSLKVMTSWDADSNRIRIEAENQVHEEVPLYVNGYYSPSTNQMDVGIRLQKVGLERMGKYGAEYFAKSQGGISGYIHISGPSLQPDLSGYVSMDSVRLHLRELNTAIAINDSFYLDRGKVLFEDFVVSDAAGNKAVCSGVYDLWEDLYDLNLNFRNFLLMNTGAAHSEVLYGKIYMSGFTNVNNRNGQTNVTVTARPERNSEVFLPLTSAFTEEDGNFLHFITSNQPQKRRVRFQSGAALVLNANLELNDNLKVQIVFDPTIGDILKTTGSGDIKIGLDQDGALNMLGEYKITKGSYLFTLGGIFNKSFNLKEGGSIIWNGSPYDATIDMSAVYNLKTSLNELLGSTNSINDRATKVPIECILSLSDNFTNPLVKFDINFPSLDSQTKSFVQSLFSSQDEINKQVFSLLMLNKFYKPDYMTDSDVAERNMGYQAGVTTATEMVSNQLSRWLSQISNNFDIDFSYRPGDDMTANEIELALSTQLLNDRVTLTANGNMDVGNTKNVTSGSTSNNIAGDFDVDVKLNRQGTLKLKAYSHTDEKIIYKNNTETIQGVGVSYQETFDTFRELLHKYFGFLRKNRKKTASSAE